MPALNTNPTKKRLVSPDGGGLATAVFGSSPEDTYVQVSSGVLSVPVKPFRKKQDENEPHHESSERSVAGPSPEDTYVRVSSDVISVAIPMRKNTVPSTTDTKSVMQKLVTPQGGAMARAVSGPSPKDSYVQVSSGVLPVPVRNSKMMSTRKTNSGIGTTKGSAPSEREKQISRPQRTKLVTPAGGSMARVLDGPYTAAPGEEPVHVIPGIIEVAIRHQGRLGKRRNPATSELLPNSTELKAEPGPF
jgi:hypothetical protein